MTMNKPIRNIMFFALIMVIILMANLSIVHVFKEDEYANNPLNRRMFIKAKLQPRGQISAGGIVLAESKQEEENGFYHREYPNQSQQFGIVEGYLSDVYGSNGIESSYNDILSGTANSPKLWWKKLISNEKVVGNVELTLIPSVQQTAYSKMSDAGYEGAVVAIKPSTGEVLAMASTPSYDSAKIADENTAEQAWKQYTEDEGSPLLNHATQDILPPGSTFKVITTAAALASGKYNPSSTLTGESQITLPGTTSTLENYGGQTCAGSHQVSLLTAFQYSCNTAFVQMSIDVGTDELRTAAAAFGVEEQYDLGLPMSKGTLGPIPDNAALGQSSIGQRDVSMSVLQNAVVAATVANGGVRMEPHVVSRCVPTTCPSSAKRNPRSSPTTLSRKPRRRSRSSCAHPNSTPRAVAAASTLRRRLARPNTAKIPVTPTRTPGILPSLPVKTLPWRSW